jgi:PAS domain S-box-containing protein
MRLLRGRFRTSDVLIIAIALILATVAVFMLTRGPQQMGRAAHAEKLLDDIRARDNDLFDLSFALVHGDAQSADVLRLDSEVARLIEEVERIDPELRQILATVIKRDYGFRQNLSVELSLVAAQSSKVAEYQRSSVFPTHRTLTRAISDADRQLGEHNQALRHQSHLTSITAALLAVLGIVLGVLLLNRTRRAGAKAHGIQLAVENQRLRDQTAVAQLLMHVARAADSTDSVERLLERALGLVCFYAGWPLGHLWLRTATGGLEPSGIWHSEENGRFPRFRKATADLGHAAEETLPGRAVATRGPVWIDDIRSETLPRALAARAEGLKSALAFPIATDGEVIAVVELATDSPQPKDRALIEITRALAVQLGDIRERKAGDVERRRLAAIVASSGDAIFAIDAENCVTSWNAAAEELTGAPADEQIGRHIRELFPRDRPNDLRRMAGMLERGETLRNFESKFVRRSGELFDASITFAPLDGGAGYAITFRDVTELRRAHERYQTLVEQLPLAVYVDEPNEHNSARWDTVYASPQIEGLLGLTPDEFKSISYVDLVHPDDAERVVAVHEAAYQSRTRLDDEYRLVRRDGSTVWVRDAMSFIGDETGGVAYSQGYLLDVSDKKANEEKVNRLLTREREQNEELRKLDRLKDEFVALVSHELRTPLTSIRGYLELVLDDASGHLTDEQRQFLSVVERNSDRLQRLVGDLLFVAQVDAGRLELELDHLDAAEVGAEAVEAAKPAADHKGLELRLVGDSHAELVGDRARLAQLVDNLISNAIKFTPTGGHVEVAVRNGDEVVTIEISDSGMGISIDEQQQLFQRFYRTASATSQAIPGTGLGLAISKAIVDAHEGTIELESGKGNGTTFRITIPTHINQMEEAA